MPFIVYLGDSGNGRMGPYDGAKPYLVSKRLRWSYPVISNGPLIWHEKVSRLAPKEALPVVRAAGFSAIWVDKYGYDDNAAALIESVGSILGTGHVIAESPRYIVFDLRSMGEPSQLAMHVKIPGAWLESVTQGLPRCGGQALSSLDQVGPRPLPADIVPEIGLNRDTDASGWAIWQQTKQRAGGIDVAVDGRLFPAFYGLERIDITNNFRVPEYRYSGFEISVPAREIGKGEHVLTLRVISPDRTCYQQGAQERIMVK